MTDVLVLSHQDVEKLLPAAECIEVMQAAFIDFAQGRVFNPLRWPVRPPGAPGLMGLMPAYRGGERGNFGLKAVCVFPGNPKIGLDTHVGGVLLFSGETGELLAVLNASAVTSIRTAAVTALATRVLSRRDSKRLAMIGTGTQARHHLPAVLSTREFEEVFVASKRFEQAEEFCHSMSVTCSVRLTPVRTVEEAVRESDVIVTVTSSKEPVIRREWLAPGSHLNLVGASMPDSREAESAVMAAAKLFTDSRESFFNESGDYLVAMREGVIGPESLLGELGEVLSGSKPGRQSKEEITIFKSLGLAMEDLAAAQYVFARARELGAGTSAAF